MKKTTMKMIILAIMAILIAGVWVSGIQSKMEIVQETKTEDTRVVKEYSEDMIRYLRDKTVVDDYITEHCGEEVRVITFHEEMLGDKLGALLVDSETGHVYAIGTANDLLH